MHSILFTILIIILFIVPDRDELLLKIINYNKVKVIHNYNLNNKLKIYLILDFIINRIKKSFKYIFT